MLTTSICYGQFKYQQRLEFPGIEKNPIYGNAYVDSYLDNENGKPKIQPGQCRLIVNNIARESSFNINNVQNHFKSRLKQIGKYYYFYWMVDTETDIEEFEERYTDSYKLKYQGMLTALKFIS